LPTRADIHLGILAYLAMFARALFIVVVMGSCAAAQDPLIQQAAANSESFKGQLPDFVADKVIWRYLSESKPAIWRLQNRITAEVVYREGRESHQNVKMDDKAISGQKAAGSGVWSTGEFAAIQLDIFSRDTWAKFKDIGESVIAGRPARKFSYSVVDENSHWIIRGTRNAVRPAYRGSIWIDSEKAVLLRIEMEALNLPLSFSFDTAEMTVDYGVVRISDTEYHLPVKAENLACQRGTLYCSRNEVEFRNYKRFVVDSKVSAK